MKYPLSRFISTVLATTLIASLSVGVSQVSRPTLATGAQPSVVDGSATGPFVTTLHVALASTGEISDQEPVIEKEVLDSVVAQVSEFWRVHSKGLVQRITYSWEQVVPVPNTTTMGAADKTASLSILKDGLIPELTGASEKNAYDAYFKYSHNNQDGNVLLVIWAPDDWAREYPSSLGNSPGAAVPGFNNGGLIRMSAQDGDPGKLAYVLAHELGHVYGLADAKAISCSPQEGILTDGVCHSLVASESASLMAHFTETYSLNGFERTQLGLLSEGSGMKTLREKGRHDEILELSSSTSFSRQEIRVRDPKSDVAEYSIEYRPGMRAGQEGVAILRVDDLDTQRTPGKIAASTWVNLPTAQGLLHTGEEFVSASGGVRVKVTGLFGQRAAVSITLYATAPEWKTLEVSPSVLSVPNAPGTATVSVDADKYSVYAPWWITATRNAANPSQLKLSFTANPSRAERVGVITLTSGGSAPATVTVTQAGAGNDGVSRLDVDSAGAQVPASGGTVTAKVTTDATTPWNIKDEYPSWVQASVSSSSEVSINVSPNTEGVPRTAAVVFTVAGGHTRTLLVNQDDDCGFQVTTSCELTLDTSASGTAGQRDEDSFRFTPAASGTYTISVTSSTGALQSSVIAPVNTPLDPWEGSTVQTVTLQQGVAYFLRLVGTGAATDSYTVKITANEVAPVIDSVVVAGTVGVGWSVSATPSPSVEGNAYQWMRGNTLVGNAQTYNITSADSGHQLRVWVSATGNGFTTWKQSSATSVVPVKGVGGTVSSSVGALLSGHKISYDNWRCDGTADYQLPSNDSGTSAALPASGTFQVGAYSGSECYRISVIDPYGTRVPSTLGTKTATYHYVTAGSQSNELTVAPKPTISPAETKDGLVVVRAGIAVTASPGAWPTGVAPTVQWFVGDKLVATGSTYKPVHDDETKTLTVKAKVTVSGTTYTVSSDSYRVIERFDDVTRAQRAHLQIDWLFEKGIAAGSNNKFYPDDRLTRCELAVFFWRLTNYESFPVPTKATFTDVPTSHSCFKAVEWFKHKEFTLLTSGRFGVNDNITRAEFAVFLYRFAGNPAYTASSNKINDVPTSHPQHKWIDWMASKSFTAAWTTKLFYPNDLTTRDEFAVFMYRMCNTVDPSKCKV
jgi:hypothetical protein